MDKGRKAPVADTRDRPQRRGFRGTAENSKTKICMRWQNGECRFGDRCNFAHGDDELRNLPPRSEDSGGGGDRGGGGGPSSGGRGRGRGRGYSEYREEGYGPGRGGAGGRGPGGRGGAGRGDGRPANGRDHAAWVASGCPVRGANGWTQYTAEGGEKYFHNSNSNVTQWETPVDWNAPA